MGVQILQVRWQLWWWIDSLMTWKIRLNTTISTSACTATRLRVILRAMIQNCLFAFASLKTVVFIFISRILLVCTQTVSLVSTKVSLVGARTVVTLVGVRVTISLVITVPRVTTVCTRTITLYLTRITNFAFLTRTTFSITSTATDITTTHINLLSKYTFYWITNCNSCTLFYSFWLIG